MKTSTHIGIGITFAAILGLIAGILLEQVVIGSNRKPEIRTVIQSPAHVTASMTPASGAADEVLYTLAVRTSCAPAKPHVLPYQEIQGCILAYLNALQGPAYNREGQSSGVNPQPYSLHPGKTQLQDPTQDAYYRQLLKEGRFPTSGSAAGRP